jgi:RNA polymerase sigma-70 factor (ECF subfamily)
MPFQQFDQAYVDALRAREPATEQHFCDYFGARLRGKLSRFGKEDAEDVRQETLTRVLSIVHSQGVRTPEALGALVSATCHFALIEHLRKNRRYLGLGEDEAELPAAGDVEQDLITVEGQAAVRAVIAQMDEKERRLLSAVFLQEREREAVCSELGATREGLRVLLHRAKRAFRKRYEEGREGRDDE